jgi:hypothetical protein
MKVTISSAYMDVRCRTPLVAKSVSKPHSAAFSIMRWRMSMTASKRRGERGSYWRSP